MDWGIALGLLNTVLLLALYGRVANLDRSNGNWFMAVARTIDEIRDRVKR